MEENGQAPDDSKMLEDARSLPLPERAAHKNWKVRNDLFEEVRDACSKITGADDSALDVYGGLFHKGVADTNTAAQDKALDALAAFLAVANERHADKIAADCCSTMVSKALKGRPGGSTVAKATEVFLLLVELDQQATVVEALIKGLSDKVPKVVIASVDVIYKVLSEFGGKVVTMTPIVKALPPLFMHKDAGVRTTAKAIAMVLMRWLKEDQVQALVIDKAPDTIKKELEKEKKEGDKSKKVTRYLRREQGKHRQSEDEEPTAAPAAAVDDEASGGAAKALPPTAAADATADGDDDEDLDMYDELEPVNVLGQLDKDFWKGLASAKWSERRDQLIRLKGLASAPRVAPGDYADLLRELKKVLVKDSNVVCQAEVVGVYANLARGLRRDFSHPARSLCPTLLDKLKEKNNNVTGGCVRALDAMHKYCFSLADVAEDMAGNLEHKNPKARQETLGLMVTLLQRETKQQVAKLHGVLLPPVAKCAVEAVPEVRDAALQVLCEVAVRAGKVAVLDKVLAKMDDNRQKKVREMAEQAVLVSKGKAVPAPAASKSSAAAAGGGTGSQPGSARGPAPRTLTLASATDSAPASPSSARGPGPSSFKATKSGLGASSKSAPSRSRSAAGGAAEPDDEASLSGNVMSGEELEAALGEVFGAEVVAGLKNSVWKERLEAMSTVLEKLGEDAELRRAQPGMLVQAVAHVPGWNEKNFQVMSKSFELIRVLAQEPGAPFGKKEAFLAIGGLHDKVADTKLKAPATEALTAMSEAVGPAFVCTQLHKKAAAHKNPKVLSESLNWMATAVSEFGLHTLNVKQLVDWCKADLGSANPPAVRNSATALLAAMHRQLGPGLADQLRDDVKPALMTALEAEFAKNPKQDFTPTRKVRKAAGAKRDRAEASSQAAPASRSFTPAAAAPAADDDDEDDDGDDGPIDMDDLLPRKDISGLVTAKLVQQLGSGNPKERMKAVEEVDEILRSAGGRIEPNVGELLPALKGRLSDSNKNLVAKVLLLIGEVAKAMGAPFGQQGRGVLAPALLNLSDSKKNVREAVAAMLDNWVAVLPPERVLPALADTLLQPKCSADAKRLAIHWLNGQLSERRTAARFSAACLDPLLKICTSAHTDKKSEVRSDGDALTTVVLEVYGHQEAMQCASTMDGAFKKPAQEMLQKVASSSGSTMPGTPSRPSIPKLNTAAAKGDDGSRPGTARTASGSATAAKRPLSARAPAPRSATAPGSSRQPAGPSLAYPAPGSEGGGLLMASDRKEERMRKYMPRFKGAAGKYEPHLDDITSLENDFTPLLADSLRDLLFHKDFKKHMEAAAVLVDLVEADPGVMLTCLDLVVRWLVLRQQDTNTNTQCLLKLIELCRSLLQLVADQEMQLTEYEALILLPCLIEKCGHNQDRIRSLYRDLIQQACLVYPVQRVMEVLLVNLINSKNNRSRVDACEEVGNILESEGLSICQGAKHRPLAVMAQLVAERDKALRQAALSAISKVYLTEGGNVWKYIGKVTPQQQSLIEERFKHLDKQHGGPVRAVSRTQVSSPTSAMHRRGASAVGGTVHGGDYADEASEAPAPSSRGGYGSRDRDAAAGSYGSGAASPSAYGHHQQQPSSSAAAFDGPAHFTPPPGSGGGGVGYAPPQRLGAGSVTPETGGMMARSSSYGHLAAEATPLPGQLNAPPTSLPGGRNEEEVEEQWSSGIVHLHSDDPTEYTDGMKMLNYVLKEAGEGHLSGGMMATLAASANELVLEVNNKLDEAIRSAIASSDAQIQKDWARVAKYALNILMLSFPMAHIARALSLATLRHTVSTVLVLLLDDTEMTGIFQGEAMLKAMNVMMLKVLENCEKSSAYMALLQLLRSPPGEVSARGSEASARFADLLVKCLIKLTKSLQNSIEELDVDQLLCGIHEYFTDLGLDEIRRRSSEDDKPLRMMKTLLHELCKYKGYSIRNHLTLIPREVGDTEPLIHAYIDLNLQSLAAAGLLPPETPTSAAVGSPKSPSGVSIRVAANGGAALAGGQQQSRFAPALPSSPSLEVNKRLATIFSMIADSSTSEAGMEELYSFRNQHPEVDLERHPSIANKSSQFKDFIAHGLAAIEAREEGRADSPMMAALRARPPSSGNVAEMSPYHRSRLSQVDIGDEAVEDGAAGSPAAAGGNVSLQDLQKRMQMLKRGSQDASSYY